MLCISIAQITKNRDYVILKLLRLQECRFSTAVRHGSEATKNMDIQQHSPSAMCVLVFQDGALGFVEAAGSGKPGMLESGVRKPWFSELTR